MPFPKVHPLGKSPVPGLGGFAGFGLWPPPRQRCDLFYFALESPQCWTGPAAVGLSFQVRLPWVSSPVHCISQSIRRIVAFCSDLHHRLGQWRVNLVVNSVVKFSRQTELVL